MSKDRNSTDCIKIQRVFSVGIVLVIAIGGCQTTSKNQSPEQILQIGNAKLARGDFKGAAALFDTALSQDPNNPDLLVPRGLANAEQGKLTFAIEDYTKALARKPDFFEAFLYRGNAYNQLLQLDQAIADFSQAIALRPDSAVALSSRAVTYYNLGQVDEAIADLQAAKQIFENNNELAKVTQIETLLDEYQSNRVDASSQR